MRFCIPIGQQLLKLLISKWKMFFLKKSGEFPASFNLFSSFHTVDIKLVNKQMFNINFVDDWSWTKDLCYWKQPLYQLSRNKLLPHQYFIQ